MARNTQSLELIFKDHNNHDNAAIMDKWPDTCPICEKGIEAVFIDAYGKPADYMKSSYIQAIFKCPRLECQAIFVAYYTSYPERISAGDNYVFLRNTYVPTFFEAEEFEQEIVELSPNFIKIYTQAKIADDMGLALICGAGYRRSLEFLIKDFLIKTKPNKKKSVKDQSLGWLIVNEVDAPKVKVTAGLAKDVGNDEAHYEKKLEELSIEDLRKLVRLTVYWIVQELLTTNYEKKSQPAK